MRLESPQFVFIGRLRKISGACPTDAEHVIPSAFSVGSMPRKQPQPSRSMVHEIFSVCRYCRLCLVNSVV